MPAPSRSEPWLEVRGVSRRFGYQPVLSNVSFDVFPGQVLLALGPNGSGKTTLLRVLAGLMEPTDGEVTRHGQIELVGHQTMVYDALSARENLTFFARLLGAAGRQRVEPVLTELGMTPWADRWVAGYSHGMKQRVAIARALLSDPDIILLDEPFSGLDQSGVDAVSDTLRRLSAEGRGIILVSHDLGHAATLATHMCFLIHHGVVGPEPVDSPDRVAARYRELLQHA